jgi:hypothetical protein
MVVSRLGRYQEKQLLRRLVITLAGIFGLIIFLLIFGLKIFVSLSLFVEKLKGNSPVPTPTKSLAVINPPNLDPIPEATFSGTIKVSGSGQSGASVVIYVNDVETTKLTVDKDGKFIVRDLVLKEGSNSITAKLTDKNNNSSDKTDPLTISVIKNKPNLEVTNPGSDMTVNGDNNIYPVTGKTDAENNLTVNDRIVVVATDGTFNYNFPLSDGDNTLKVAATNAAGNSVTIERKIKYQK